MDLSLKNVCLLSHTFIWDLSEAGFISGLITPLFPCQSLGDLQGL